MTTLTLSPRQELNRAKKEAKRIESEKNQKPVKEITINIEWRKSRMWGNNPFCEARVTFQDGSFERSPTFKASGCGYDKESTVIAQVFNTYLKYKLHVIKQNPAIELPYGIYIKPEHKSFEGGIGTSCYYRISEAISGKFEHIANGKSFDAYKYTDLNSKNS